MFQFSGDVPNPSDLRMDSNLIFYEQHDGIEEEMNESVIQMSMMTLDPWAIQSSPTPQHSFNLGCVVASPKCGRYSFADVVFPSGIFFQDNINFAGWPPQTIPREDTEYLRKRELKVHAGKQLNLSYFDTCGYNFENADDKTSRDFQLLDRFISGCKEFSKLTISEPLPELDPNHAITVKIFYCCESNDILQHVVIVVHARELAIVKFIPVETVVKGSPRFLGRDWNWFGSKEKVVIKEMKVMVVSTLLKLTVLSIGEQEQCQTNCSSVSYHSRVAGKEEISI